MDIIHVIPGTITYFQQCNTNTITYYLVFLLLSSYRNSEFVNNFFVYTTNQYVLITVSNIL